MGPWARSFVAAVAGRAERPSDAQLAQVRDLTVDVGTIRAQVGECTVTLMAERVPARIWSAMTRFAQGRGSLEEAVEGGTQSVHLEHLMIEDWSEPLVPRPYELGRSCSCDGDGEPCEHVAALAFAVAEEIDADPSLLLRWRGCVAAPEVPTEAEVVSTAEPSLDLMDDDPWRAGALPEPRPLRPLPVGAVLKRLGPSGLELRGEDLADVLQRAYASFAESA